jgi:two-component system, LytTR family, sensor kinase
VTTRAFWRVQLVVWSLYGLVHYLATLPAITPADYADMAGIKAVRALAGLLVSSVLPWIYRPALKRHARPLVLAGLACLVAFVFGNAWLTLDRTLLAVTRALLPLRVNWAWFPHGFDLDYAFVLLAWSGGYIALSQWQEATRRREDLLQQGLAARDAQLRALAYQLSPHLLFNALNSLRGAIAEDPARAREMVTRLADFLRYSLSAPGESPVSAEIGMIRTYLSIEEARFEHGVSAAIEVDPDTEDCLVPTLLLQPLVENAAKHGRPDASGVRRIRVATTLADGRLRIEVANTGRLDPGAASGVGVANTRERLARACGPRQRFALTEQDGWVRAVIEIDHPDRSHAARADR